MAYVLDTSALVSYLKDEPEAGQVEVVLRQPDDLMIPFMTMMELRYVLLRAYSLSRVDQIIETLRSCGASVVESSPLWGIQAADIKARGGLSLGDAWIASLALMHDAELVHKDPEFDLVEGLRSIRL